MASVTWSTEILPTPAVMTDGCDKRRDSCPPGHEMDPCAPGEGYACKRCSSRSFQPNINRYPDKCRLRMVCDERYNMEYRVYGSTVQDASCKCKEGTHFENEDQRACVPNIICDKGYGQGEFGKCIKCLDMNMYSDKKDRIQKCMPLTNCEKDGRCTIKRSNGTFDNVCGPRVHNLSDCSDIMERQSDSNNEVKITAIAASVAGALFLLFLIVLLVLYLRKRRRRKYTEKPLTHEQLEDLKLRILERCEKDEQMCRKVLAESFHVIEERIDRQIWTLAQELYRSHYQPGRYNVLVEKYKESQAKYAINGYLQEWRAWKGENHTALGDMFSALRQSKRDDIVYEISNRMRHEIDDFHVEVESGTGKGHNRARKNMWREALDDLCPCGGSSRGGQPSSKEEEEHAHKLLEIQAAAPAPQTPDVLPSQGTGAAPPDPPGPPGPPGPAGPAGPPPSHMTPHMAGEIYRGHPYPSAPCLDDHGGHMEGVSVTFHRQYSQPVQATT